MSCQRQQKRPQPLWARPVIWTVGAESKAPQSLTALVQRGGLIRPHGSEANGAGRRIEAIGKGGLCRCKLERRVPCTVTCMIYEVVSYLKPHYSHQGSSPTGRNSFMRFG